MKKLIIISLFLITIGATYIFLKSTTVPMHESISRQKIAYPLAIYEWRSLKHDANTSDAFFKGLQQDGVKQIYLNISDSVDIAQLANGEEKGKQRIAYRELLRNYVLKARKYGISVMGLTGDKSWSEPEDRYLAFIALDEVLSYNRSVIEKERLRGLQYDIEPYNLDIFPGNETSIITNYLDTVKALKDRVDSLPKNERSFNLAFALPYWFDGENGNIPEVTYGSKTAYPFYHVADILRSLPNSTVILMAYRNAPEGENGTIALVSKEFAYTKQQRNLKLVVAQETVNVDPSTITFYGMSKKALYTAMDQVSRKWIRTGSFGGLAIHDAVGYEEMNK